MDRENNSATQGKPDNKSVGKNLMRQLPNLLLAAAVGALISGVAVYYMTSMSSNAGGQISSGLSQSIADGLDARPMPVSSNAGSNQTSPTFPENTNGESDTADQASLRGQITGLEGYTANLQVILRRTDGQAKGESVVASIGVGGDFIFSDLAPGEVEIVLEIPGKEVSVREGVTQRMPPSSRKIGDITLKPGVNKKEFAIKSPLTVDSFEIKVTLNDQPGANLVVFARSLEAQRGIYARGEHQVTGIDATQGVIAATTDEEGAAHFETISSGSWTFLVRAPDGSWSWVYPAYFEPTSLDVGEPLEVTIRTYAGEVTVIRESDSLPLRNRELHFYSNFSEPGFRLTTDDAGRVYAQLPPGTYYVETYPRSLKEPGQITWGANGDNIQTVSLFVSNNETEN